MTSRAAAEREPASIAAGLTGTLVIHAAAGLVLWATVRPIEIGPQVYAVELVAAPAPAPAAKPAPEAVSRPPAEEPAPNKPAPKPTAPSPKPPAPAPKPTAKTEPTPRSTPRTTPLPGEAPSTGTDAVSVSLPGLAFPYPEYLRTIVQEVYRRWDRPAGNAALRAEVSFLIRRDGSVSAEDIRLVKRSGNYSFDLSAQGAIEAAGIAHAFGALPDGWHDDVLPVSFYFTPRTQ